MNCPNNIVFKKIPPYGDLIRLSSFIQCVMDGSFIDDDGIGYLATEHRVTDQAIVPSDLAISKEFPEWVTHILWFNK